MEDGGGGGGGAGFKSDLMLSLCRSLKPDGLQAARDFPQKCFLVAGPRLLLVSVVGFLRCVLCRKSGHQAMGCSGDHLKPYKAKL